jgi:hypothetical protein
MSLDSGSFSEMGNTVPQVFRRIDSLPCREENSILIEEDSKEHHVISLLLTTPQVLTHSVIRREMEESSYPNSHKTHQIPDDEVTSYGVSTMHYRLSDPNIR